MKRFASRLVVATMWAGLMVGAAGAAEPPVKPGAKAPDFAIQVPGLPPGRLSDLKGSVVVLDFWASWCPWCMKELPDVNRIDAKYDKVIVIGIDDEDAATIAKTVSKLGLGFHTLPDPNDAICDAYGVDSFPSAVVIDAKGNVSAVIEGYHDDNTLEKAVQKALAK
jgi:peroxiredoxin